VRNQQMYGILDKVTAIGLVILVSALLLYAMASHRTAIPLALIGGAVFAVWIVVQLVASIIYRKHNNNSILPFALTVDRCPLL